MRQVRCHVYFSALRDGYESSLAQQAEELTTHTAAEESLVTLTSLQTPPSRYDWSAGELDLFIPCGLAGTKAMAVLKSLTKIC